MVLLSVLIVLGLIQLWGSGAPLHHDAWFERWVSWLRGLGARSEMQGEGIQGEMYEEPYPSETPGVLTAFPGAVLVLSLLGPVLVLMLALHWVSSVHLGFSIIISVPVLLYCLGRGEFSALMQAYLDAWNTRNWAAAVAAANQLGADTAGVEPDEWPELHRHVLSVAGYSGFERMFAVLFWFVLLGPAAALLYRLSALYRPLAIGKEDEALANRWLWILEWPAVRVLGLSFALTGNFVGCFQQWRAFVTCVESSSAKVLMHAIRGALLIGEQVAEDVSDNELRALQSLLSRTLLLWVCVLAAVTLLA